MKKFITLFLCLTLMGCGGMCQQMTTSDVDKAKTTLTQIQGYYNSLQGLLAVVPVAGPVIQAAVPLAMQVTDASLKALGQMIATNCADEQALVMAQSTLEQLQKLLAQPEVQKTMAKYRIKAPK